MNLRMVIPCLLLSSLSSILSFVSTSSSISTSAKDYFALSIEDGLKPFVSRPITPELFAQISSSLSAFLELEARARKIGRSDGSKPYSVLCNSSNNTQSTIQRNRVIVDVEISLLGLADKIFVYLDSGIDKTIVNTN